MPENHEESLNAVQQIEAALASFRVRMPWKEAMTSQRREVILSVILDQLETAGPAGFAAMCYFGMIRRKRPGPLGIRRAANAQNIVEAIEKGSLLELEEFKAGLDELTLARIKDAGDVWWVGPDECVLDPRKRAHSGRNSKAHGNRSPTG